MATALSAQTSATGPATPAPPAVEAAPPTQAGPVAPERDLDSGALPAPSAPESGATVGVSQQFPFVTLDQAMFFGQSQYGRRLTAELEARQTDLAQENRRIEADLAAREQRLTDQRPTLSAEAFRTLADRFNADVERHRLEQAGKEREIYQLHERDRALFQDIANQALAGLLREIGALAIIAEEAIVLGFRDIDITEAAVLRLDALVGDGSQLPQPNGPEADAPEADAPEPNAPEDAAPAVPDAQPDPSPEAVPHHPRGTSPGLAPGLAPQAAPGGTGP